MCNLSITSLSLRRFTDIFSPMLITLEGCYKLPHCINKKRKSEVQTCQGDSIKERA